MDSWMHGGQKRERTNGQFARRAKKNQRQITVTSGIWHLAHQTRKPTKRVTLLS